jgi:hypothetical protein
LAAANVGSLERREISENMDRCALGHGNGRETKKMLIAIHPIYASEQETWEEKYLLLSSHSLVFHPLGAIAIAGRQGATRALLCPADPANRVGKRSLESAYQ